MKNLLGIMQGRLLPKYEGRYQAHPVGYWQDEFSIAAELELDCIEFILDYKYVESNPLLNPDGRKQIRTISEETGVKVVSVCADYFMEAPLHSVEPEVSLRSLGILEKLIDAAGDLGIKNIVIPCVEQSGIVDLSSRSRLCDALGQIIPKALQSGVNLALETELGPLEFHSLLNTINVECVTVNYDTGNSASLGFDTVEELDAYGRQITDVHIKDRQLNGGSVVLGSGAWEYGIFLTKLKTIGFDGPFILQAFRDDEGVEIFKNQLNWFREIIWSYDFK